VTISATKPSRITGVCAASISHGRKELDQLLTENFIIHPRPVGGRPSTEKKYPNIRIALEQLLSDEIAGDPMSEQRWVRSSTYKLTTSLNEAGYRIGRNTVWRLLKDMGFSLKANKKKFKPTSYGPGRDEQFNYIAAQKKTFISDGLPTISVDTKKKEWIGNFKRSRRPWCKNAEEVLKYDFTSLADCRAVPYGIYEALLHE
jgi:DDE family transposase